MASQFPTPHIASLVKADHAVSRHLHAEYKVAKTNEVRQHLIWHMIRETSQHASKEEDTLYPLARDVLGEKEYDRLVNDDLELKKLLARLDATTIERNPTLVNALVEKFMQTYEEHMQHEEKELLPKLLAAPGVDAIELGHKYEKAATYALTRPHPWAPRSPPWDKVVKQVAWPVDYVRDFVRFVGYVPPVQVPAGTVY